MLMPSKSTALSIPAFARLLGLSSQRMYQLLGANRGPKTRGHGRQSAIPLDSAISWIEAELHTLYATGGSPQRRRRFEDALRELRVQRVFERAQARQRQQRFGFSERQRHYITMRYDHEATA
jgi:predicted DNA-binding transcriptional regulator AlpA